MHNVILPHLISKQNVVLLCSIMFKWKRITAHVIRIGAYLQVNMLSLQKRGIANITFFFKTWYCRQ